MKQLVYLLTTILFFSCNSTNVNKTIDTVDDILTDFGYINIVETTEIVTKLSSNNMNGREAGTEDFIRAAEYIETIFNENNYKPLFDNYRDEFEIDGVQNFNLVAANQTYNSNQPLVLLTAHLDHLGPKETGVDKIYNGANDNASGVTGAIQIFKYLQKQNLNTNIVVCLFSGEEKGLRGSAHLAQLLKEKEMAPSLVFNFEMIGVTLSSGANQVYVTGYNQSNMAARFNEVLDREFVVFFEEAEKMSLFQRSDNYPFYREFKIPSQTFSSYDFKNSPNYHTVGDEISDLNVDNMNAIINSSAKAIERILKQNIEISLNK